MDRVPAVGTTIARGATATLGGIPPHQWGDCVACNPAEITLARSFPLNELDWAVHADWMTDLAPGFKFEPTCIAVPNQVVDT